MSDPINPEVVILNTALELPIAQRAAYLEQACASDPALRQRVEELLQAHEQAESFLEPPPARLQLKRTVLINIPVTEKPGDKIGRYKLLQQIGEGGCGVVYMAEQEEPVRRRVALKVIKLGMDTKSVIARFEAERQALAMMDHPNIAKVLDAGATETGRPYFVMELVRGVKITDYCDENKVSTANRLKLFIQVCQSIQHAHQKGVIHRDIKPSNILVTVNDGVPVPKVIDFGIAKATQGRLTDQTVFTAFEQFIGTPAYMSPEQAVMTSLDIDTRSDIYSLGVLLYELLTGKTPFGARELLAAGLDEMRRTILEAEPPKPSTRLTQELANAGARQIHTQSGDEGRASSRRLLQMKELIHLLRGDLDWIVMKCLEKDRGRRYDTANGLAMDITRHLESEPVIARPPSNFYRFQKGIRRHRTAFATASAVGLALLAGAVLSTWQALRARKERDMATQARQQSEAINRFLTEDLLYQATPEQNARDKKVTMEEVLERAGHKLDQTAEFAAQPVLEATLRYDIGSTCHKLGLWGEAERHLRRSVLLRERQLGPDHRDTLAAKLRLATLLLHGLRRFEEGEQLSHETLGRLQRLIANRGDTPDAKLYRDGLDAVSLYAQSLMYAGKREKALELTRQNAADYERMFGPDDLDSINELQNLALVTGSLGNYGEAERHVREALQRYTRSGKADDENAINGVNSLALYRQYQGDVRGAEQLLTEAQPRAARLLGPIHPLTLHLQFRLARVLAEEGRLVEAEELARKTLTARQQTLPANSASTAVSMLLLGRILLEQVPSDPRGEAEALLQQARTIFIERLATMPELAAAAENWLGAARLARHDYAGAEGLMLQNVERVFVPTGELSPNERRLAVGHLVELYRAWGKPEEYAKWERKLDDLARVKAR